MKKWENLGKTISQFIAILMLLWALNPDNPYAYYVILRVVICAVVAYHGVSAIKRKHEGWAWILGVLTFVYNPVFPLHLNRGIWSVINVVSAVFIIFHIWFSRS